MLYTVPQYVDIIKDSYGLTRMLGVIEPCCDASGRFVLAVGNSSVVFKIKHKGKPCVLKCYTRPKRNTRRIYGERCLHNELFVAQSGGGSGAWVDVVLTEWVEGRTLKEAVLSAAGDAEALTRLSAAFDRFAVRMLSEEWAHGDIKPENIIVDSLGEMHAIDFDAVFLPCFTGESSEETGTAAYQHPTRSEGVFNKHIDDYPLALISTALGAMSAEPELSRLCSDNDVLLLDAREIYNGKSDVYQNIVDMLRSRCLAARYRIAKLLASRTAHLYSLGELLGYAQFEARRQQDNTYPEPFCRNGLWGYACGGETVVPPLYDDAYGFCDGEAVVVLDGMEYRINACGSPMFDLTDSLKIPPPNRRKSADLIIMPK